MKRNKHAKKWLAVLAFLLAWLAVACSGGEAGMQPEALPAGSDATPPPPVAYGASLDEWSEAVASPDSATADAGSSSFPDPIVPVTITVTADPFAGALIENTASVAETPTVAATSPATATAVAQFTNSDGQIYQEMFWDALVPADYTPDAIMAKYADQLAQIVDGSPEAAELYATMQAEFNNAPINEALDGVLIRLPGFIAPLEFTGDEITEFLLVPYFGACIHVPPPPINQTVLVRLQPGSGIDPADAYYPIWVMGLITTEENVTELASAGYTMQDAFYELYDPQ